jgi:hypothetical protein
MTLVTAGEYKGKGSLELYSLSPSPAYAINSSDSRTTRNSNACYQNRQTASSSKLLSAASHGTRLVFSDGDGNMKWVERDGSTPVRQFNINDAQKGERGQYTAQSVNISPGIEGGYGDIVQKIMPTLSPSVLSPHTSSSSSSTPELGTENLVIWTGDGKLGMVGFGREELFDVDTFEDALERQLDSDQADTKSLEKEYSLEMRRALEQQAREVRWLRGYGL